MAYELVVYLAAQKQLRNLERAVAKRILKKMVWFSQQEDPLKFAIALHKPAIGDYRFRIGEYRIIVNVSMKKKQIQLIAIGHRREIYREVTP